MRFLLIWLTLLSCLFAGIAMAQSQTQDETTPAPATVTIPKADWDALLARLDTLEKEVQALKDYQAPAATETPAPPAAPEAQPPETEGVPVEVTPPSAPETPGGGKFLALPDISLVVQAKGLLSSDTREEFRNELRLNELELGIQGWVYPNVKADAFVTMSPAEDESAQVEEAYLTYIGFAKGLNVNVGEKHVAFDRVNLLHNHSWLYVRQPLVLTNLVAPESLGRRRDCGHLLPADAGWHVCAVGLWARGRRRRRKRRTSCRRCWSAPGRASRTASTPRACGPDIRSGSAMNWSWAPLMPTGRPAPTP